MRCFIHGTRLFYSKADVGRLRGQVSSLDTARTSAPATGYMAFGFEAALAGGAWFGFLDRAGGAGAFERHAVVSFAVFVVLRELLIRPGLEGIGREGEIGEGRKRQVVEAQFLFEISRFEKGAEEMLVGQSHGDGTSQQTVRFFETAGGLQPARQPQQVRAVAGNNILRVAKRRRDQARETRQRNNIEHVVMEHRDQTESVAGPQVFEIVIGDQFAGHVGAALEAENLVFEIHQAASFEAQLE